MPRFPLGAILRAKAHEGREFGTSWGVHPRKGLTWVGQPKENRFLMGYIASYEWNEFSHGAQFMGKSFALGASGGREERSRRSW
jgi:hypothetical protein